ncbi:hypothetical protein GTW25_16450 [Aliihoeflea aestuarii]|jgi:hypothetical protein|uniref:hypothetical protein n=1 Tax=Aliihoeflea aestuarii TaxID=453840 RepID=UPI0020964BDF|nr:hypothetical protein [Aliihoeflea aestuarii]MCO6392617.1 hypothetical protein [Aliihoeflea aestuarii]
MLMNLSFIWMALALASVVILSFLLGLFLDTILGEDGFGAVGNTFVLAAGFFLTIGIGNHFGYVFRDLRMGIIYGTAGACAAIVALTAIKAVATRLRL